MYVGIDVSKAELEVAVRPLDERMTLANDRAGIKRLVGRLGELKPKLAVVEATGGLQRQVVAALWMAGIAVAAANPSWVRNFAKGRGVRVKTDRKDAELLALFAERERPEARPPADAETQALQALVMRREQLVEMRVADQQRLARAAGTMRKELRHHIAYLEGRIKRSNRISTRPCGVARRGGARARSCAACRASGKGSARWCWRKCRSWARSTASRSGHWWEWRRCPMTAVAAMDSGSSPAAGSRCATNSICVRW